MFAEDKSYETSLLVMRVYGASSSSVQSDVNLIMGVNARKKTSILTKETGTITVTPEIYSSSTCPSTCSTTGSSGGSEEIYCLLIIAVLMAVFAIVWAVVMIIFAIVTAGGFFRRRYRTIVVL